MLWWKNSFLDGVTMNGFPSFIFSLLDQVNSTFNGGTVRFFIVVGVSCCCDTTAMEMGHGTRGAKIVSGIVR